MIYEISHKTLYSYSAPVAQSQHILHLSPRHTAHQSVVRDSLLIEPAPSARHERWDYFGNRVVALDIEQEHSELVIHARSIVDVKAPPLRNLMLSPAWDTVGSAIAKNGAGEPHYQGTVGVPPIPLDILQFVPFSNATWPTTDITAYAQTSFPEGRPVLDATWDLMARIWADFKFDSASTDLSTPISQVFLQRSGVCQDFSHFALACLRAMGLPARYVSGYILTRPPPGQAKLQGADASHAWISVWGGEMGWVDFDPTNKQIPKDEHVTLGFGRDYTDVSPISGILLGGGAHSVEIAVDVLPV